MDNVKTPRRLNTSLEFSSFIFVCRLLQLCCCVLLLCHVFFFFRCLKKAVLHDRGFPWVNSCIFLLLLIIRTTMKLR